MIDIYMRNLKDACVTPFLALIQKHKFSPNYITALSGLVGLISIAFTMSGNRIISAILLLLSRTLDGLDGAYARATQ